MIFNAMPSNGKTAAMNLNPELLEVTSQPPSAELRTKINSIMKKNRIMQNLPWFLTKLLISRDWNNENNDVSGKLTSLHMSPSVHCDEYENLWVSLKLAKRKGFS